MVASQESLKMLISDSLVLKNATMALAKTLAISFEIVIDGEVFIVTHFGSHQN